MKATPAMWRMSRIRMAMSSSVPTSIRSAGLRLGVALGVLVLLVVGFGVGFVGGGHVAHVRLRGGAGRPRARGRRGLEA